MEDYKKEKGVCAKDNKARSKPMRNILTRLLNLDLFEAVIFGDKVIDEEDIEKWPTCDVLISFFSKEVFDNIPFNYCNYCNKGTGFPLKKAMDYVKLRKPYCVNKVGLQELLLDRRFVLRILDKIGVPTPNRIIRQKAYDKPIVSEEVVREIKLALNIDISPESFPEHNVVQLDSETIMCEGRILKKPFVEKPISGEDHNINIYYSAEMGGGGRKLFRKIGNKSSEYSKDLVNIRMDASYIYEEFMMVDNAEDVKVYTIGKDYAHAETRKSPVVDGIVKRNADGKEIRYVTPLSEAEQAMARKITLAFGQNVCGFDLLRANGGSFVIDVNGWSFVKGNTDYYTKCSEILGKLFLEEVEKRNKFPFLKRLTTEKKIEGPWKLKAFLSVLRHADRTPKQKMKFNFKSQTFIELLNGGQEEVVLKKKPELELIVGACKKARTENKENQESVSSCLRIMQLKMDLPGTKVQIKPIFKKADDSETTAKQNIKPNLVKVQLVLKWGGNFTHGGKFHSQDLGENLRKDLLIINKDLLTNIEVYSSSEQRVTDTAEYFSKALLELEELPLNFLNISKEMLDDSNAAKEQVDLVKKKLQILLSPVGMNTISESQLTSPSEGNAFPLEIPSLQQSLNNANNNFNEIMNQNVSNAFNNNSPYLFPDNLSSAASSVLDPSERLQMQSLSLDFHPASYIVEDLIDILRNLRFIMRDNFKKLDVEKIQTFWCCHEDPFLFKERWEKLFKDFCDVKREAFEASKVSELYDSLKYDLLHNRKFIDKIFYSDKEYVNSLYFKSKALFDFVGPKEYGIEEKEKFEICLLSSSVLVNKLVEDLKTAASEETPRTRLFFTKESKVICLLNFVLLSGLNAKLPVSKSQSRSDLDGIVSHILSSSGFNPLPDTEMAELDYLTQITFELYERGGNDNLANEYSLRIGFSPGAHDYNLIDMQMDERHALGVKPRKWITEYIPLHEAIRCLSQRNSPAFD
ncbi:hypothetical protein HK099_003732 [Clydaea vesicula]|uniref:Inositol hexakisphosphate and diphosphoinositol-pentakisphosphate kinase n=1 Tax=Clydaea vesicula TaxID=447962 RepID=A0AAD5U5W0_9FUNG|nr:hypothetical protein HK099_003732 [Clydaea vesicula]KAJ3387430.1 hypothetical protein HDU92_001953 [Lobulomyces angularis]